MARTEQTEQTEQTDASASQRAIQATLAELRGHNAQLIRQQEMLLLERDDLMRRANEERTRCEVVIAQWRQRSEESLEAQLELAAQLNAMTQQLNAMTQQLNAMTQQLNAMTQQRDATIQHVNAMTQQRDALAQQSTALVQQVNAKAQIEETLTAKNEYITHLESLLGGSPKSLLGAWLATRRRQPR